MRTSPGKDSRGRQIWNILRGRTDGTLITNPVMYDANGNEITSSNGESVLPVAIKDLDIITTKHDRYLALPATASTWPGNDTFSVAWDPSEGVTRYRVWMESVSANTFVKVCEDAVNEAQAEVWLANAVSSRTADVQHRRVYNALKTTTTTLQTGGWSDWQEFPESYGLTRLDFLGSAAEIMKIWVEAE